MGRFSLTCLVLTALAVPLFAQEEDVYVPADAEPVVEIEVISEAPAPAPAPVAEPTPAPAPPPPAAAPTPAPAAVSTPPTPVAAPVDAAQTDDDKDDGAAIAQKQGDTPDADAGKKGKDDKGDKSSGSTGIFSKPTFELSLGATTVGGEQWTRIALGMDVPIWKFGVFFDLELYIDAENNFSSKGWEFSDSTWANDLWRKIRYVRFGREHEPLFIKVGGLDNVTFGYGMIVDRFTNMLRYPDEKLIGSQFYLNDISPLGVTLQTLVSDYAEALDKDTEGGVMAARLAVKPLKMTGIPILQNLSVGGTYAIDRNYLAPARKWGFSDEERMLAHMREEVTWFEEYKTIYNHFTGNDVDAILEKYDEEKKLSTDRQAFELWGLDFGLPLIRSSLLGLDLYGHSGFRTDKIDGWGVGVPGVALKIWRLNANVEYRYIEGRFTPGFFDTYYLNERFTRTSRESKDERLSHLDSSVLNGVFGRLGMDVFGVLNLGGAYQYMVGKEITETTIDPVTDLPIRTKIRPTNERYEAVLSIGDVLVSRIPKIERIEVYIRNNDIGTYQRFEKRKPYQMGADNAPVIGTNGKPVFIDDAKESYFPVENKKARHFDPSPGMYWGYRAGFEIGGGASLIADYRYGWKIEDGTLKPNNQMLIQTAFKF